MSPSIDSDLLSWLYSTGFRSPGNRCRAFKTANPPLVSFPNLLPAHEYSIWFRLPPTAEHLSRRALGCPPAARLAALEENWKSTRIHHTKKNKLRQKENLLFVDVPNNIMCSFFFFFFWHASKSVVIHETHKGSLIARDESSAIVYFGGKRFQQIRAERRKTERSTKHTPTQGQRYIKKKKSFSKVVKSVAAGHPSRREGV